MEFKKVSYKSTGPILQAGAIGYMIQGAVTGDAEAIGIGFIALMGGQLVTQRNKYMTGTVDKLNDRISELEKRLEEDK